MPEGGAGRPSYEVRRVGRRLDLAGPWDGPAWSRAGVLEVSCFRAEGSGHRPRTSARLLYDDAGLWGLFRVEDRFVRSVHTRFGEPVCRDSCVELFLEPAVGRGYLNFEWNAGGTLLASHVLDPVRTPEGFRRFRPLTDAEGRRVLARSSLPPVVDPERPEPVAWTLGFFVPFSLLGEVAAAEPPEPGTRWRGNLYKCGDDTSHPHWASWSPLTERNFHLPACFGILRFA